MCLWNPDSWSCHVSTLAVEWIEIPSTVFAYIGQMVSTLAVEWIEIRITSANKPIATVSTLAVEWIEICC